MQLRAWTLVAVVGVAGYAARRGSERSEPAAPAVEHPKIERVVAPAPRPALEPSEDADADGDDDDEVAVVDEPTVEEERIVVEAPLPEARGNTVHGRMHDADSGEPLAGVTIVAQSPALDGVQTAITDENGYYRIVELPTGEYTITVYYMDETIEHPGVWVRAVAPALVEDDIETGYRPPIIID